MRAIARGLAAVWLIAFCAANAAPQERRSLQLAALQRAAIASDPRSRELALQEQQTDLRLKNIAVQRYPSMTVEALAQYQSDVPTPPLLPTGQSLFTPSKSTLDGHLRVDQRIFDPTVRVQSALERAQL